MSEAQSTATAREVWLMVALAVARDGLIAPRRLNIDEETSSISFGVKGNDTARPWAKWFDGLESERYQDHQPSAGEAAVRKVYFCKVTGPGGWLWSVDGEEPLNPPPPSEVETLAEQVTAAIEQPAASS